MRLQERGGRAEKSDEPTRESMMSPSRTSLHAAAFLLSIPLTAALGVTPSGAQSLGDVARKAEASRAGSASKVYTNESLPASTALPAAAPAAPPAAQAQAGGAGQPASTPGTGKTPPEQAKAGAATDAKAAPAEKDEKYWRQRLQAEREALARAQAFAEALQSRINALSTDFVNRDDPAQRNTIAADRQKALTELERVQKEIAQHTQAIADIQQEARRAGVPAGWVR